MDLKLSKIEAIGDSLKSNLVREGLEFRSDFAASKSQGSYLEQTAPALKTILAKLVDERLANNLSKTAIHFLSGKYHYGSFNKELRSIAQELWHLGLNPTTTAKLVERIYGTLTPEQKQSLKSSKPDPDLRSGPDLTSSESKQQHER